MINYIKYYFFFLKISPKFMNKNIFVLIFKDKLFARSHYYACQMVFDLKMFKKYGEGYYAEMDRNLDFDV